MSAPDDLRRADSFYAQVGGADTFRRLVHAFYQGVRADEPLRALYPEEELTAAEDRLRMFLEQYWGGPTTYGDTRGHPRLRMRHAPFHIDSDARDRWLTQHARRGGLPRPRADARGGALGLPRAGRAQPGQPARLSRARRAPRGRPPAVMTALTSVCQPCPP